MTEESNENITKNKIMKTAKELLKDVESQFDASKVPGVNSVFHFLINGENGGDFTVLIENDTCKITEGLTGDAKCTVKSSAEVFDMVMTGKMNPTMAVMGGKLKISNIGEIMKFAEPFGIV